MNIRKIFTYPGMIIFYFFLIAGLILLFRFEKGELLILINQAHNPFYDLFFKNWTYLGDGLIFGALIVFFIFKRYYYALGAGLSIAVQTILVQGMKRVIFPDLYRPKLFFDNFSDFHLVEGVEIRGFNAFPSGHTATAFTLALILSIYLKNKNWSLALLLMAILVGFSRMYLLQHFFIDVYFGAICGMFSVFASFYFLEKRQFYNKAPWNQSILDRI